ncbi:MAG: class I SAM-dependent methyltransferase [Chitinophagaceae bacterium]
MLSNDRVHYSQCPVCASKQINPLFAVKDYSVSKEDFVIWQCGTCTLRFTQDAPTEDSIAPYYKSPDYISHTNAKKGLLNNLYQRVRKYTLEQKAKLLIEQTKAANGNLLDVGAGVGAFINVMQQKGWTAQGIEPDLDARLIAQQEFGTELSDTAVFYNLPAQNFDAITLWHVLEHVHDLHRYVEQLKNLLVPNGKIFIAVPNYQSADAAIYRLKWAAYDVPRHLYHFSPTSMQALMERHGLNIIAKKPMWFDSFYISLLSSKYKKGSLSWIGAFISGLRSNTKAAINKDRCSSIIYIISK